MAFLFALLLLNSKKCSNFAVEMIHAGECGRVCLPFALTRIFQRHNKRRLLTLVLVLLKSGKFPQPKARECNKRPLVCIRHRADSARVVHISVDVIVYSCWKGLPEPNSKE